MRMRIPTIGFAALLAASACSAASGSVAGALVNTAVAGGVAGARRAGGDCYTVCNPGSTCNPKTGYCDPAPCRGECLQNERCDESTLLPRCVSSWEPAATLTRPTELKSSPPPADPKQASPPTEN